MKTIYANIICKNEEEMLPTCLESIKGVDEIIFLDTGSEDKSIQIAKDFGAKVYEDPWIDNFSHSRNVCKGYSNGDWNLIIDCDEVLNTPISQLKQLVNAAWLEAKAPDLILFDVQTPLERNEQPRLIRNSPDIWYYAAAHNLPRYYPDGLEKPETSIPIPHSKAWKTTYTVTANVSPNHKRDPDRTLRILQKSLTTDPMNTRNIYYYVREWLNRKEPEKALYWLGRYFKISGMTNECADAHFIAATCHLDLGDPMSAVNEALEAIKILPSFRASYEFMEMLAHPEMKPYWNRFARIADNKGVLFIRDMNKKTKTI